MKVLARAAVVSLLALAFHASAESRVCIGGDLDHLNEAQKSGCWNSAHQIGNYAAKFHAPADWHFFVVCTDSDWKAYTAFSKRKAADLAALGADTDLEKRVTFFRGEWLRNIPVQGLNQAVAHEVAIALLQSTDEKIIQRQVALWVPETDTTAPVLRAAR
jgi:hypothetical protein